LQGRKSVERPFILRMAEVVFCLFGSGSSGLGRGAFALASAGTQFRQLAVLLDRVGFVEHLLTNDTQRNQLKLRRL
jgi:hypothetical protein